MSSTSAQHGCNTKVAEPRPRVTFSCFGGGSDGVKHDSELLELWSGTRCENSPAF